mmetsp:Transcript_14969/g.31233  ORF Transcript_14969/g.31233 Transcript_14969/m.31233 type:complete len:228 (-) Transcript_14969:1988-2671(-)
MFCSMIHPPSLAILFRAFRAIFSCPCPMEMLSNCPFASVLPSLRPKASMVGVGSTPGKSTKKKGVMAVDSSKEASMSKGGCSTKSCPRLSMTNCDKAAPIRSCRMTRSRKRRWNWFRSRALRGRSAFSAFSSEYQRFQPRESCSMFWVSCPPFLKASMFSSVFSCAHWVSDSQLLAFSGITGGVGSGGQRIKVSFSSAVILPARTRMFMHIILTTVNLSESSSPRRV